MLKSLNLINLLFIKTYKNAKVANYYSKSLETILNLLPPSGKKFYKTLEAAPSTITYAFLLNAKTKPNLSLNSPFYAEACNELAVPNCPSPRHSAKATRLLA